MLPPRPIVLRLIRTAGVLWLAARAGLALLGVVRLGAVGALVFIAVVVGLTWMDVRATDEDVLLADLAVSPAVVSALAALSAAALEVALAGALAFALPAGPGGSALP